MYREFYGLRDYPFGLSPDPRFLLLTPTVREALACLQHCVQRRMGFMVLVGEVGTGKTTLLRSFMDDLERRQLPFAYIFNPRLSVEEFLEYLLSDLEISCETSTKSQRLMCLNEWLLDRYRTGLTTVLIVDEAQLLSDSVLEEIRLLTNLETGREKLLQIVLAGQPELAEKLAQSHMRQLRQRIFLRCNLSALTRGQTGEYVRRRLACVGSNGRPIFSDDALDALYSFSQGIPRVINTLCEHALVHGYVHDLRPIGRQTIDDIAREFDLNGQEEEQPGSTTSEPAEKHP